MKVLAIDTSSRCGVIGLCIDSEPMAELAVRSKETHSARLLPGIDWLLKASGLVIEDIDAYGVAVGPGSFTGLRVGVATVKALAYAHQKPVVALNSLEVLCLPFQHLSRPLIPALNSRTGRIYAGVYVWEEGAIKTRVEAKETTPGDFVSSCPPESLFIGEGSRKYFSGHSVAAPAFDIPSGLLLSAAAFEKAQKGDTLSVEKLEPEYVKSADSEFC